MCVCVYVYASACMCLCKHAYVCMCMYVVYECVFTLQITMDQETLGGRRPGCGGAVSHFRRRESPPLVPSRSFTAAATGGRQVLTISNGRQSGRSSPSVTADSQADPQHQHETVKSPVSNCIRSMMVRR